MRARRSHGQSLVELALIAPVLILLAMSVWDGGSVLHEQVVLQQAARDGARVAATAYGSGASSRLVMDAVLASAADLPTLNTTPGYLTITYPDAQSVQVNLKYNHALITPIVRQLWAGGAGTVGLQASATFYVPQLTQVPATVVASTPTPTPTPTSTPTVTPTLTPTPTPTPRLTCVTSPLVTNPTTQVIPQLPANWGYWCQVQLTASSVLLAGWTDDGSAANQVGIYPNTPDLFGDQLDPTSLTPPNGNLATDARYGGALWGVSQACLPSGSYTTYFFHGGPAPMGSTSARISSIPC